MSCREAFLPPPLETLSKDSLPKLPIIPRTAFFGIPHQQAKTSSFVEEINSVIQSKKYVYLEPCPTKEAAAIVRSLNEKNNYKQLVWVHWSDDCLAQIELLAYLLTRTKIEAPFPSKENLLLRIFNLLAETDLLVISDFMDMKFLTSEMIPNLSSAKFNLLLTNSSKSNRAWIPKLTVMSFNSDYKPFIHDLKFFNSEEQVIMSKFSEFFLKLSPDSRNNLIGLSFLGPHRISAFLLMSLFGKNSEEDLAKFTETFLENEKGEKFKNPLCDMNPAISSAVHFLLQKDGSLKKWQEFIKKWVQVMINSPVEELNKLAGDNFRICIHHVIRANYMASVELPSQEAAKNIVLDKIVEEEVKQMDSAPKATINVQKEPHTKPPEAAPSKKVVSISEGSGLSWAKSPDQFSYFYLINILFAEDSGIIKMACHEVNEFYARQPFQMIANMIRTLMNPQITYKSSKLHYSMAFWINRLKKKIYTSPSIELMALERIFDIVMEKGTSKEVDAFVEDFKKELLAEKNTHEKRKISVFSVQLTFLLLHVSQKFRKIDFTENVKGIKDVLNQLKEAKHPAAPQFLLALGAFYYQNYDFGNSGQTFSNVLNEVESKELPFKPQIIYWTKLFLCRIPEEPFFNNIIQSSKDAVQWMKKEKDEQHDCFLPAIYSALIEMAYFRGDTPSQIKYMKRLVSENTRLFTELHAMTSEYSLRLGTTFMKDGKLEEGRKYLNIVLKNENPNNLNRIEEAKLYLKNNS